MDPIPELNSILLQLPELTDIEEMFIARVHALMKAHRLSRGSIGYQGNMINMRQDMIAVINKLPFLHKDLAMFVAGKKKSQ